MKSADPFIERLNSAASAQPQLANTVKSIKAVYAGMTNEKRNKLREEHGIETSNYHLMMDAYLSLNIYRDIIRGSDKAERSQLSENITESAKTGEPLSYWYSPEVKELKMRDIHLIEDQVEEVGEPCPRCKSRRTTIKQYSTTKGDEDPQFVFRCHSKDCGLVRHL